MKKHRIWLLVITAFCIAATIYCYQQGWLFNRFTEIELLKAHPERYQNPQSATVKGIVLATTDFMGFSACKISDDTGKIYVLTNRGYREGDQVIINGHIENILGKSSLKWLVFVEDYLSS